MKAMWLSTVLVCGASALVVVACSSSSAPIGSGDDGGQQDQTNPTDDSSIDQSSASDTNSTVDTNPNDSNSNQDTSTDSGNDGTNNSDGADGGMCAAVGPGANQYTTGSAGCDSCLASNCCPAMTTCVGNSACLALLRCVASCVADGGTVNSCEIPCATANAAGITDAMAVGNCQGTSCPNQCM
jgi:hypothetical protein